MIAEHNESESSSGWLNFFARTFVSWVFMWLGIALAGGLFGTFIFPIVGTIFGLILAGMAGGVTSLFGIGLHVTMREKLPLRVSSNFAGAVAGFTSWGGTDGGESIMARADSLPLQAITTQLGSLGAVICTGVVLRMVGRSRLSKARRPWRFSVADLLLFTTWLAVLLTAYQVWLGASPNAEATTFYFVTIVVSAMLLTELICWCYRKLLLNSSQPVEEEIQLTVEQS